MQILWLSYYYLPHVGGGTWATYNLSKALVNKGHNVHIIVPNVRYRLSVAKDVSQKIQRKNLSKVHRTPRVMMPRIIGPFLSPFFIFLAGLRLGKNADVIVCQFHPHHLVPLSALLLTRIFKVPLVIRACDIYRYMGSSNTGFLDGIVKTVNAFNESLVKFTDVFLVAGLDSEETLMSRTKESSTASKIHLTSNGFAMSDFSGLPSKKSARRSIGIKPNEKVVLFVGRFSGGEYGTAVLLEAFSMFLKHEPNSLLLLVGDALPPILQEDLDLLGIRRNVRIYGPMPHEEVVKFIVASDVCIGPLKPTSAMALKLLEYMACGKPVITGIGSATADLSPATNFILTTSTPKEVSCAVSQVFLNEDYAKMLGSRGKEYVKRFTWEKLGKDFEGTLVETVKNYRKRFGDQQ